MLLTPEAAAVNFLAASDKDKARAYAAALGARSVEKADRGAAFHLEVLGALEPRRSVEERALDLALASFMSAAMVSENSFGLEPIGSTP